MFLSAVLGGETLRELRIACAVAELEREGGVSQRVSPLAQVRDCGNLLTRAGMRLPAVDVDTLTMNYPSAHKLVEHLRFMGETNAGVSRRKGPIGRETAAAAAAAYHFMFPAAAGAGPPPGAADEGEGASESEGSGDSARAGSDPGGGGGVECTWQVLYMTGWSPGDGQQQASERGSAGVSLSQLEEELSKVPDDSSSK
jgi:NADH dehydrogenase [ubiquinone] 1 alpha subcomplex assembly factor 5